MVFEYIIRSSPRRRASPCLAEGFSPTASAVERIYFSISISPMARGEYRFISGSHKDWSCWTELNAPRRATFSAFSASLCASDRLTRRRGGAEMGSAAEVGVSRDAAGTDSISSTARGAYRITAVLTKVEPGGRGRTLLGRLQSPSRALRSDRHARRSVREDIRHRPSSGGTPRARAQDEQPVQRSRALRRDSARAG